MAWQPGVHLYLLRVPVVVDVVAQAFPGWEFSLASFTQAFRARIGESSSPVASTISNLVLGRELSV